MSSRQFNADVVLGPTGSSLALRPVRVAPAAHAILRPVRVAPAAPAILPLVGQWLRGLPQPRSLVRCQILGTAIRCRLVHQTHWFSDLGVATSPRTASKRVSGTTCKPLRPTKFGEVVQDGQPARPFLGVGIGVEPDALKADREVPVVIGQIAEVVRELCGATHPDSAVVAHAIGEHLEAGSMPAYKLKCVIAHPDARPVRAELFDVRRLDQRGRLSGTLCAQHPQVVKPYDGLDRDYCVS